VQEFEMLLFTIYVLIAIFAFAGTVYVVTQLDRDDFCRNDAFVWGAVSLFPFVNCLLLLTVAVFIGHHMIKHAKFGNPVLFHRKKK
jgi:hypothetical protein